MATTFIIDCPVCKAKVGALEKGRAQRGGGDENTEPWTHRIFLGSCPRCSSLLVGESWQTGFEGYNAYEDEWSDIVRVFPNPPKTFSSNRIPRVVTDSLVEADRSLQANANIAACAMLGRALEAVCRDVMERDAALDKIASNKQAVPNEKLMLAAGIKLLREKGIIDDRLYEWSQQLHAIRNDAAHPADISIARNDAEDLQTFVYAIVEYIYDLTDRYEDFKARAAKRASRKLRSTEA